MPRLRNKHTGSVVNVADDLAARLGAGWESVDDPEPQPEPKPRRGRKAESDQADQ